MSPAFRSGYAPDFGMCPQLSNRQQGYDVDQMNLAQVRLRWVLRDP